ncbi:hypothetical protein HMPREF0201_00917 [Cedecea davisae DSM 4568]|uniref:Uncharacterized protein n=1 Tax=Cedecea davisae DSM 4568 TaxID=566551 RepID=S3IZR5_9ENTR|nr:hypothetical protein HMPREF0201_00917 [Cedecea davisae DSM 4568]
MGSECQPPSGVAKHKNLHNEKEKLSCKQCERIEKKDEVAKPS